MNKRRKRYANLHSMADLRNERLKLRKMIRANEAHIAEDRDDIYHMISPSNIIDTLMCRLSARSSALRYVVAGARAMIAMVNGRRSTSCKCN